jgi:serine/threonine protein kinase
MAPGAVKAGSDGESGVGLHPAVESWSGARRMEQYRREWRVAAGSISEVWRATASDGRPVALKCLTAEFALHEHAGEWLRREYGVLSSLSHPSIVTVYGLIGPEQLEAPAQLASRAIVLEWLGGGDLVSLAGSAPKHWIGAADAVAAALEYLHDRGLAHGDVKARNVLFDDFDRARLVDFSSALPVGSRGAGRIGTTTQQRPRRRGHTHIVDTDDDVFAFAALLYELLYGYAPFATQSTRDRARREEASVYDERDAVGRLRQEVVSVVLSNERSDTDALAVLRDRLRSVEEQCTDR